MRTTVAVALVLLMVAPAAAQTGGPEDPLNAEQRQWLERHGPVKFGVVPTNAPHTFQDEGSWDGWGVEAMELIALKLGLEIEFVSAQTIPFNAGLLANGSVDVIGPYANREDVSFARKILPPLSHSPTQFVTTDRHPEFASLSDLKGRVTTIAHSPLEARLLADFPHLEYVEAASIQEGIEMLADGRVDSYYGPLEIIGWNAQRLDVQDIRPVGDAIEVFELSYWVTDPVLESILNAGRQEVSRGELRLLHVKWTGYDLTEAEPEGVPAWVRWSLGLAVGALVILAAGSAVLRFQVQQRTRSLDEANANLNRINAELDERVRSRTAALEASRAEMGMFVHLATHDLRAPIRAMNGFASILKADLGDQIPAESRHDLERIIAQANRMDEMIQGISRLSDIGRAPLDPVPINAADVAEAICEQYPKAPGGAAIEWIIEPSIPVVADSGLLQLALQNLMANAARYAAPDAPKARVLATADGVAVEDNGEGVSEAMMDRVWLPFQKGEREHEGMGLGLSTVRRIMERHGGTATVELGELGGARFTLRFPRLPGPV